MRTWKTWWSLSAVAVALVVPAGCGSGESSQHGVTLAPPSTLPHQIQGAPLVVQEAYRFALANSELLSAIPCYCGCGSMGHTSNLSCYVQEVHRDGSIVFDDHAVGCGLCVDITRDVMRMVGEGTTVRQMQDRIIARYSRYGPGTSRFRLQ